jgi:DNA-binding NtrC family response regulator
MDFTVLSVEPEDPLREDCLRILREAGCSVEGVATKEHAEAHLMRRPAYEIVFLEPRLALRAGDGLRQVRTGFDLLDLIEGSFPETRVFVMTSARGIRLAAAKAASYSVVSGIFVKPPAWGDILRHLERIASSR